MMTSGWRILVTYSCVATTVIGVILLAGARPAAQNLEEITVHRINVVEPDGTLRMVISNHASFPGLIVHGKEEAFARPQAGVLFYNDEGSENGGLIFAGRKDDKGQVVDSGGSLSFDKYDASQIVQLAGVDDKDDRFAGLAVSDSQPGDGGHRRIWVGKDADGTATMALMDAAGKKRIILQVKSNGSSSLVFLDASGKPLWELAPKEP